MDRRYGCPRCGAVVGAPDPRGAEDATQADLWWCEADGLVAPLVPAEEPSVHALLDHLSTSAHPTWLPWPLPHGWSVAGTASVGLTRRTASVVALSGPDPLDGLGDLVVVCEEPGTGLGSRLAGVDGPDPGAEIRHVEPHTRVQVGGHATPLWWVGSSRDRDVLVGRPVDAGCGWWPGRRRAGCSCTTGGSWSICTTWSPSSRSCR